MTDDGDHTPETEPSLDESAPKDPPTEATAGDAPTEEAAEDPSPKAKTPWVAAGVGAVALLTIVLVALSYMLPAPRAAVPAAWTASAATSASPRTSASAAKASSSDPASSRPSSATPTTRASDGPTSFPTTTRCSAGQTIASPTWTAIVPTGWTCAAGTTSADMRNFQSATGDAISVGPSAAHDAVTACSSPFGGQTATVERFADTTWGGRKAVTVNAQFSALVVQYRCVDTPAGVYMMGGVVRSSAGSLVAGMEALAASWVWK